MKAAAQTLEFDKICSHISNFASSPIGNELAKNITPINNLESLQLILDQVSEMKDLIDYDSSPPIDGIYDIRPHIRMLKMEGSALSIEGLFEIYSTLTVARQLHKYFKAREEKSKNVLKLASKLVPLENVEKELLRCIDFKAQDVKSTASPELAQIRQSLNRAQSAARKKLDHLLKSYSSQGMLQENVVSVRDGRLVLVVKDEFKRKIRGLIHDQSSSGSSFFIEPIETLEDNNRIRELEGDEQKEIRAILAHLTNFLRDFRYDLEQNLHILSQLDLLNAKALFAREINANQPELVQDNVIEMFQARHPLLNLRMGQNNVVPMDIKLGSEHNSLVISGPNAGGKTVALKTVGLLTMMVRCGLLVPVLPHSKFGFIDKIFACIGDQQSIENDLSTFSSHIESLKQIVDEGTPNSLVLIDEIASGTDPDEGIALAMSLINHLTELGSNNIVTTHLSALKAYAYKTAGVENASLEFDITTLRPTYHFRVGIPGSSYAFEIARRMGFSEQLTTNARELVGQQKNQLEDLIIELENKLNQHKELVAKANIKEAEYRGLARLYEEKKNELEKNEKKLKRQAAEEAELLIREASATIERTVKEIKEANAAKEVIKEAKSRLDEQKEKIKKIIIEPKISAPFPIRDINVGDHVKWSKTGGSAVVVSSADKQKRVYIQAGGAKIRVPIVELVHTKRPKQKKTIVKTNVSSVTGFSTELDLRGMRLEEAQEHVDQFLDEAILTGLKEIRIIHGKGTGSLRSGVGHFLKSHPLVVNSRLGNWNEGDSGVTVVELREQ